MIQAFLYYVINAYPRGIETSRLLDQLSRCIMEGGPLQDHHRPDASTFEALRSYNQIKEKEMSEFKEDWASIETPIYFPT
jgi:hypothetical protein